MEHDTHIGSGLKAQCLVSIRSPLPTNAQWIDLIRIVQKVSIYDWFVTSVGDQKPKKYWGKKMTFLRIFWLRAKSHHSIFPWSSDLMISNLISTSFYFVKKIGIFNAIYILVFCDYVLLWIFQQSNQVLPSQSRIHTKKEVSSYFEQILNS